MRTNHKNSLSILPLESMSHFVQAFVGSRNCLEKIQQQYSVSKVVDLNQGLALLPLLDSLYDAIPNDERTDLIEENWHLLAPKIVALLLSNSSNDALGYFETAYSGEEGDQGAVLARNGKIVFGPEVGSGSINTILGMMGITKETAIDEFAAVGLSRFRSNEKWLQESANGKSSMTFPLFDASPVPVKGDFVFRVRDQRLKNFAPGWRPRRFTKIGRMAALPKNLSVPLRAIKSVADAGALAEDYLLTKSSTLGELMILPEKTIQKPYGWIFFYDSKEFLLTGNISESILGSGPLVVLGRFGAFGKVIQLGSSIDPDKIIFHFEQRLKVFFVIYLVAALLLIASVVTGLLYFLKLL